MLKQPHPQLFSTLHLTAFHPSTGEQQTDRDPEEVGVAATSKLRKPWASVNSGFSCSWEARPGNALLCKTSPKYSVAVSLWSGQCCGSSHIAASCVSLWPTTPLSPAKVIAPLRGKYSTCHNNNRPWLVFFFPETCLRRWVTFRRKSVSPHLRLHWKKKTLSGCVSTDICEASLFRLAECSGLRSPSWGAQQEWWAFNGLTIRTFAVLRDPVSHLCLF